MRGRKQPTRRRKALCSLAVLALWIVYVAAPGQFRFLPSQAIREAERLGNIGPTQLILELPGEERRALRGNSKGLMICSLRIYPSCGWEAQDRAYLDCSKPEPFHVGLSVHGVSWKNCVDWYGRVDDPKAEMVRLELYEWGELQSVYTLPREEWVQRDGFTYFILEFEKSGWAQDNLLRSYLLDGQGNLLGSRDLTQEFGQTDWEIYQ